MSIVLVCNRRSGRGAGERLIRTFRERLTGAGHAVTEIMLGGAGGERFDPERFRGARALLAFGGDGTVNAVADASIRTGTPVYHVPAGNENLVARRYGMSRDPGTFLAALAEHRVVESDVGLAEGRRFLIMATVGPDARVIERLHFARTRAIGHLAYTFPVLREAFSPHLPCVSLVVDGVTVVDQRRGWLIVANDREYASRLNFASGAGPTTRALTAVFLPAANLRDCLNWTLRAWTRRHTRDPRLIMREGKDVRIVCHEPGTSFQIDGEHDPAIASALGTNGSANGRGGSWSKQIRLGLDTQTLPVLSPRPFRL